MSRKLYRSPDGRLWAAFAQHPSSTGPYVFCRYIEHNGALGHAAIWPKLELTLAHGPDSVTMEMAYPTTEDLAIFGWLGVDEDQILEYQEADGRDAWLMDRLTAGHDAYVGAGCKRVLRAGGTYATDRAAGVGAHCELCGGVPDGDTCVCPECPVCHAYGDPTCYDELARGLPARNELERESGRRGHGLRLTMVQMSQRADYEAWCAEEVGCE